MITIGVANEGKKNVSKDTIAEWKPEKITYTGVSVFFKVDDIFYSMDRKDFDEFFKAETTGKYVFNK